MTPEEIKRRLIELRIEHRDLDEAIARMAGHSGSDELRLRRLKKRFDAEGIAIPYPHMTLVTPRKGGEAGADEPAA